MKYQFIEQHKHEFAIVVMSQVLGVSESGFYAWRKRKREDALLTQEIEQVFDKHLDRYTDYRTYLQQVLHLKPNSVNRSLISLNRYFAWVLSIGQAKYDPAKVVKLVGEEVSTPRHLDDQEEQALVAAVTEGGNLRDRAIIVLMLYTGLRARELCTLTHAQVKLGKRSGTLSMHGKHNKHREIPLNATARAAQLVYDSSLQKPSQDTTPLFIFEKRHTRLTERGLGYLIKKMPPERICMMSVLMTCVIALATGWLHPFPCTA